MGPMVAANNFVDLIRKKIAEDKDIKDYSIRCTLKGSLAFTGKGHATDRAITLGLHGYSPAVIAGEDIDSVIKQIWNSESITLEDSRVIRFSPEQDIIFDRGEPLAEHPNGMIFQLLSGSGDVLLSEIYFSIGGGFINTQAEISQLVAPIKMASSNSCAHAFDNATSMLRMSADSGLSIAEMKRENELGFISDEMLNDGLDAIWSAMERCIETGLDASGILPGGLSIKRRAKDLFQQLKYYDDANLNDWLCAYAMAVNEENAAGHMVVTAPTNGAAGVIPAVLYYFVKHENGTPEEVRKFLITAGAIGGLIKHLSSISGAEVGCQGEVGSAASMAAAGLCAVRGGTTEQIENAAEIALEHHLGMTCDPVNGLVQVPCIERNGFGAIKAFTAASLAMRGSGQHFMPLDACIAAMKKTGEEMSHKYKETALGGLAVSITEC